MAFWGHVAMLAEVRQNDATGRALRVSGSSVGRNVWLDAYSALLALLILAYFVILFTALFQLLLVAYRTLREPAASWTDTIFKVGAFSLVGLLTGHVFWRLWRGIPGLVTTMHDEAGRVQDGILLDRVIYAPLYELVDGVGQRIGAPRPDEIRLGARAECYVLELRRFAMRTQRRLVLVLGLPHLMVLSQGEVQVIVAHELAHLRRGDTTLGVFVYRFLESLRAGLDDFGGRWWRWLNPVYWYCECFLRLLLVLATPVRRQQELLADCISAAAYGGELAVRTLLKEWLLAQQFDAEVAAFDPGRRAAENPADTVYSSFLRRWREFSPAGHAYLEQRLAEEENASIWDSHPTFQQRLRCMRRFPDAVPLADVPARSLLPQRQELERHLQPRIGVVSAAEL